MAQPQTVNYACPPYDFAEYPLLPHLPYPNSYSSPSSYSPALSWSRPGSSDNSSLSLRPSYPTNSRGAGTSIDADRSSPMNVLSAAERESEPSHDYTCCGINLQDIHALVDHFEEHHVVPFARQHPDIIPPASPPNPHVFSPPATGPPGKGSSPSVPVPEVFNDPSPSGPVPQVFSDRPPSHSDLSARLSAHISSHLLVDDYISPAFKHPRPNLINIFRRGMSGSDPKTLTSSSWLRNMDRLSSLIDQLSELAATAPQEHQTQLFHQVAALRKDFNKQQERYAAFLRLTKEYADRFLSDISDEIKQQSSFLDALENRLQMAKKLRKKVVDLRKSYELGTLNSLKKVRRTVLSQPLPEDADLFNEMDILLNEIRRCYVEMDKFWVDEVRRVTKALKDRRVDPEDINRWKTFRDSLEQTIAHWETRSADKAVAPCLNSRPSIHDLGPIASTLSGNAKAARRKLESVWLSQSVEVYLKQNFRSFILQARVKFSANRQSFLEFLQESVRYGKSVVMTCTAFTSYSPFTRSRTSQDLVDDAARLGAENMKVSAETVIQTREMRAFNSILKKDKLSLHKLDRKLCALSGCISAWVTELDAHSTFPAFDIKQLQRLSCIWLKNRNAILAALSPLGEPDSDSDHPLETFT